MRILSVGMGAHRVQVLAASQDEANAEVVLEVARRIAQRIQGDHEDLWASTMRIR